MYMVIGIFLYVAGSRARSSCSQPGGAPSWSRPDKPHTTKFAKRYDPGRLPAPPPLKSAPLPRGCGQSAVTFERRNKRQGSEPRTPRAANISKYSQVIYNLAENKFFQIRPEECNRPNHPFNGPSFGVPRLGLNTMGDAAIFLYSPGLL